MSSISVDDFGTARETRIEAVLTPDPPVARVSDMVEEAIDIMAEQQIRRPLGFSTGEESGQMIANWTGSRAGQRDSLSMQAGAKDMFTQRPVRQETPQPVIQTQLLRPQQQFAGNLG